MNLVALLLAAALLAVPAAAAAAAQEPGPPRGIPRFELAASSVALTGPARPGIYLGEVGRRAAILGHEDGGLELWVWPLKLAADLTLAFKIPEYDEPIPGARIARQVIARPEGATIVYSHATFTVRAHHFVPLDEPGGLILLDVETVRPLDVYVRLRADFNLAWPGSFGGEYIVWDGANRRFLLSQGGVRLYNAVIGSPFADEGTSHPAHDAPTIPSQLRLRFQPERAGRELIPIAFAGGVQGRDSVYATYQHLLEHARRYWEAKVAHYDSVREHQLSITTPDPALDLALEWAKVNLDQQLTCNPDLGCGLVAGFGVAGHGNFRPGFGWYFGGDAAINSFAMDLLGQHELVRQGLGFFARYQREDGKIAHEISHAAGRLPWFDRYPYTWFHGDTTPFWLRAIYAYWLATADTAFIREHWARIRKAYAWCLTTDTDGDGLMENPSAGAGAIEVGGLGEALWSDIYLSGVWVAALQGIRELARAMGDAPLAGEVEAVYRRAAAALDTRFWLDGAGRYAFAILEGGRLNDALTVWPATALAFGLLDPERAGRTLAQIASPAVTTDWGARMLSSAHPLYDPLHYNNGAVWPFVTGFAAAAQYAYHRGWSGHELVHAVSRMPFDFALGRFPELLSGAFYRTLDTTVPHQFFGTSTFALAVVRGLFGLEARAPEAALVFEPHLPADWERVAFRGFPVGGLRVSGEVERGDTTMLVRLRQDDAADGRRSPDGAAESAHARGEARGAPRAPLRARIAPALPLGATDVRVQVNGAPVNVPVETTRHDTHPVVEVALDPEVQVRIVWQGGFEVVPVRSETPVGGRSEGLRILDVQREAVEAGGYLVELGGRAGTPWTLRFRAPRRPEAVTGGTLTAFDERGLGTIQGRFATGPGEWTRARVLVR